ncbi:M13 family metallopeptidase [Candidatus Neomarinimicrobiota bacterium]
MPRTIITTILIALVMAGCASMTRSSKSLSSGIDQSNFDTSVRPQDDFYEYVNGNWMKNNAIPSDRSNWGSFSVLIENAQHRLRTIVEESAAATDNVPGSENQKVGDFYNSYLDTVAIADRGMDPIRETLDLITAISNREELVTALIPLEISGVQDPLAFFINQDGKDTERYALYVTQSGLGLPDRDYYFKDEERFVEIRAAYTQYIGDLLALGGQSDAVAKASRIMEIESSLAEHHWTATESRDRDKTYNKMTIDELTSLTPNFEWPNFLAGIGAGEIDYLIIREPSYLEAFDKIFGDVSVADWKAYLTFKLLDGSAPYLTDDFVALEFSFNGTTLQGITENSPRWKRAVTMINNNLGEAVGKIYVERYFPAEAKLRMVTMVDNLEQAFLERLDQLDWMGDKTKGEARTKMSQFTKKIGYPDEWRDYSSLEITPDDLMTNVFNFRRFGHFYELGKLGGPINRQEWFIPPQTVNAFYNPTMNQITFPAAILQPPFFNLEAEDAVSYGAIGAAIGHEMSHGFDDQGRKSDGRGNLREWWTPEDEKEFEARAQVLVEQFNGYNPIDSLYINGEFTLGENIGDLGGLLISHRAYHNSLKGKEAPVIDGLTGDQRFFMGWAQVWRRLYRDDEVRRRLVMDPHSISRYRVNGIVSNMDAFYETFDVKEGDGMYIAPEDRVRIW